MKNLTKLKTMLSKHLNDNHPINDRINNLSEYNLKKLKKDLKIKLNKKGLKLDIAYYFFFNFPEKPLTKFEEILSKRLLDQNIENEINQTEKGPVPNEKNSQSEKRLK